MTITFIKNISKSEYLQVVYFLEEILSFFVSGIYFSLGDYIFSAFFFIFALFFAFVLGEALIESGRNE